jgi:hypothetical protein
MFPIDPYPQQQQSKKDTRHSNEHQKYVLMTGLTNSSKSNLSDGNKKIEPPVKNIHDEG